MTDANVEVVRQIYEGWAHGEFPGPDELLDEDIEYVNPESAVEPGTRYGLDQFMRAVEKVFEGWETWDMTPERFEPAGDQVAVLVRYSARGRTSGAEVDGRESALWTIRDGKAVRYEWFHDPADAFKAAGLEH